MVKLTQIVYNVYALDLDIYKLELKKFKIRETEHRW